MQEIELWKLEKIINQLTNNTIGNAISNNNHVAINGQKSGDSRKISNEIADRGLGSVRSVSAYEN